MSFLTGLGGIGAGLISANKILRDQENDKINNQYRAAMGGLTNIKLTEAKKAQENEAAYGEIAAKDAGTQTILRADAPADEFGEQQTETIAKPNDRRGGFDAMAQEALKRGDNASYAKFVQYGDHLKKQQDEGMTDIAKMVHSGNVDPASAEKMWNSNGDGRVVPGSAKWDATTGTLSGIDATSGKLISMDKTAAQQYLVMSGNIKPDEYLTTGINKRTGRDANGEVPASREDTQIKLQQMRDTARAMSDDKRFNTMLQAAEARSRRGELGGKPPTHVATAEWLLEKGIATTPEEAWQKANQLGEAVNEKVTTDNDGNTTVYDPRTGEISRMDTDGKQTVVRAATKGLSGDKKPAQGDAKSYLQGATSQEDFNQRAKALKAKGWTTEQIKAAAQ